MPGVLLILSSLFALLAAAARHKAVLATVLREEVEINIEMVVRVTASVLLVAVGAFLLGVSIGKKKAEKAGERGRSGKEREGGLPSRA
jgi:hypothetical protein